ncbi:hypothetical protein V8C34DRAFT_123612 [Trichoderma compactum]
MDEPDAMCRHQLWMWMWMWMKMKMAGKAPKPPSRRRRRQQPFHRCILPNCQMLLALASLQPRPISVVQVFVHQGPALRSIPTASRLPIGCAPLTGHHRCHRPLGSNRNRQTLLHALHCASAPGGRVCRTRDATNDWKRPEEAVCVHVHVHVRASARVCNFRACRASAHCATRFPQQRVLVRRVRLIPQCSELNWARLNGSELDLKLFVPDSSFHCLTPPTPYLQRRVIMQANGALARHRSRRSLSSAEPPRCLKS